MKGKSKLKILNLYNLIKITIHKRWINNIYYARTKRNWRGRKKNVIEIKYFQKIQQNT